MESHEAQEVAAGAEPACATLELHEIANLFPPMRAKEFAELVADIKEHGQLEPIWTHQGKVIDGRHRLRACRQLGLQPLTREWDGAGSLLEFVIALNLRRRHLKETQRAMIAARMMPAFEEEATRRHGRHDGASLTRDNCPQLGRASDFAGKVLQVSGKSVYRARKVLDHGISALIDAVDRGAIAVSTAAALVDHTPERQGELLKQGRHAIAMALRCGDKSEAGKQEADAPRHGSGNSSRPVAHDPTGAPDNIPSARWSENPDQRTADEWLERNFPAGKTKLKKTEHGFVLEFIGSNQDDVRADLRLALRDEQLLLGLLKRGVWLVWKESA
jgi:hypothetical protein